MTEIPESVMEEARECCPVCGEDFATYDVCATDIELGTCHAKCLEGSPVVDLETGEPISGSISTFIYDEEGALAEGVARAVERPKYPQWTDEEFEVWWNRDPFFCANKTSWGYFTGTRKEYCLWQARAAVSALSEAILAAEKRGEERERARCAKVADRWKRHDTGYEIAAAIRKGSD